MFNPKVIAFYLPQYHPVAENNEWFGPGFTEWTLVAKSKPLYRGHVQPKIPADLGFYDLRLPEVRKAQALLAQEAGVSAFCYYHYWFGNGKVILEKPLQEVVRLGEPDFPFCLCWANHSWFKKQWNPKTSLLDQSLLIKQSYPGHQDIIDHFFSLKSTFEDKRYFRIDGRLVFVIYDVENMPDYQDFVSTWNQLAKENSLPGFYFISYTQSVDGLDREPHNSFDATILALVSGVEKHGNLRIRSLFNIIKEKLSRLLKTPLNAYEYSSAMKFFLAPEGKRDDVIPVLVSNWDYTPRRGIGGLILKNSTPDLFYEHVKQAMEQIKDKPESKQVLFLKSWNEWGEGNYIEPDLEFGKKYIQALRKAIDESVILNESVEKR